MISVFIYEYERYRSNAKPTSPSLSTNLLLQFPIVLEKGIKEPGKINDLSSSGTKGLIQIKQPFTFIV